MKIPAIPESVKNSLEDAGLDFHKYDKFKHAQREIIDPSCNPIKVPPYKT